MIRSSPAPALSPIFYFTALQFSVVGAQLHPHAGEKDTAPTTNKTAEL